MLKLAKTLVDAFMAMGGNFDKSGFVEKSKIVKVIEEFELTINIDEFLDKIPGERLDFENFCDLFDTPFDDSKSSASMRSVGTRF